MWRNLQKLKKNENLDNKLFDSSGRKLRLWLITQPRKILFVMNTDKKRNRLLDEKETFVLIQNRRIFVEAYMYNT